MTSTAWEPILVTLKHQYTMCVVSALAPTLYSYNQPFRVRPSTYATSLSVVTADVLPPCHLIGQSVNSVSTLPHIPHLLASVPHIDICCHHALCPQESNHCRGIFTPSHFEPSYQYPVKTIPNTLPFMHRLHYTQSRQDIQIAYSCLYTMFKISSSTWHKILKCNNCSLASNMQDILALVPVSTNLMPVEHIPSSHRVSIITLQPAQ